jgi:pimeloyl-ACP methyl ester carboxylesterase
VSTTKEETLHLKNGKISIQTAGSGPTILLLHGLGGASGSWKYQLETLQREYTVIAWDAPGYGRSDRRRPDVDAYADALQELAEASGFDGVTVVGHSMGGVIAGRLAARNPGWISRLVLSSTFTGNGNQEPDAPLSEGYRRRIQELDTMSREDFGRARARSMTPKGTRKVPFDLVAEIAGRVDRGGYEDACRMLDRADNREALMRVRMPVLILSAEKDTIMSEANADQLAELIPHAQRETVYGVGHAPYIEDPEQYNRILINYIRRL